MDNWDGQTNRLTDIWPDRQMDGQTEIWTDRDNRTEVKSTEELCSDLKATNDRILEDGVQRGRFQRAGNLVVGGKDVEAFYPNMDVDLAAEEVKLEVEESNVDMRWTH